MTLVETYEGIRTRAEGRRNKPNPKAKSKKRLF